MLYISKNEICALASQTSVIFWFMRLHDRSGHNRNRNKHAAIDGFLAACLISGRSIHENIFTLSTSAFLVVVYGRIQGGDQDGVVASVAGGVAAKDTTIEV